MASGASSPLKPAYAAFDLVWLNDRDLRVLPLWRRKRALKNSWTGHRLAMSIMWMIPRSSRSRRNGIWKASSQDAAAIPMTRRPLGKGETPDTRRT